MTYKTTKMTPKAMNSLRVFFQRDPAGGCRASIVKGRSSIVLAHYKSRSMRATCRAAARLLREQADRLDALGDELRPYALGTLRRVNTAREE